MTKPIDDIALRYALRLNTLIRDMRRDLTNDAFKMTVEFICDRNGAYAIINPGPILDPRRPIRAELKQHQEQKQ